MNWREDRDRRRQADRERRNAERSRRLNQRGESPPAWEQDPWLASTGGAGCGCWDEDRFDEADY
jgi:hypothetical protein